MSLSFSDAALMAFWAKERLHMTNAQCWKHFPTLYELTHKMLQYEPDLVALSEECRVDSVAVGADGMICAFDQDYPALNPLSPEGDRPFLLFYRGNISLLQDLNKNIAVIGSIDPDDSIVARERSIINCLVARGLTIVSGLAKGCDTEAHQTCIDAGGKTIAILPTQLEKIYPAKNRKLAEEIVKNGGLLLTEYSTEAVSRYEAVKRFADRDRLQALFSKAVIMIASHRKGEGDSGSRYAMESAKKYRIGRYVMFDRAQDIGKSLFGLNQDLLQGESDVRVLCHNTIETLARREDRKLFRMLTGEQSRLNID